MDLGHVHHVAIIGSSYEKSRHFYVEQLGFSVIRENYRAERGDWKIDLRIDDHTELELFIMKNHPHRLSPQAYGLRHLAFRVEDVPAFAAKLEAMGIACEPVRWDEFTGNRMTFFRDPDGLPLEIHE